MRVNTIIGSISLNFERIAVLVNTFLPILALAFFFFGQNFNLYFHIGTWVFGLLTVLNIYCRRIQTSHALLRNYGVLAFVRYMVESIGPEFRQYLFMSDTEERPFSRVERSEVYQKAKGIDSSSAFGSQLDYDKTEVKLRHSMYPISKKELDHSPIIFGEERGIANTYKMLHPLAISAMSYGALGENAVRALAKGAKRAGIAMNTGEGGYPKYHLLEGCDLIFQIGTAKFGVRDEAGNLQIDKLKKIAAEEQVKMIEIKMSQGAKPGKGGILPKEKITEEIAGLRGVPMGKDVISPPYHDECNDADSTADFIKHIQDITALPVGVKTCFGRADEFEEFVLSLKRKSICPDYIAIDGAEGGTGAAPSSFMDHVGVPIFNALKEVNMILKKHGLRDKLKIMCSGKLINSGKQMMALSVGADVIYTARGFMLSIGCIQAMQCNRNTCPVGITTHKKDLQKGLDVDLKARRVENYANALLNEYEQILASLGKKSVKELCEENLYIPR